MRAASTAESCEVKLPPVFWIGNSQARKPIRPQVPHDHHQPALDLAGLPTSRGSLDEPNVGVLDQVLRGRVMASGQSQRVGE